MTKVKEFTKSYGINRVAELIEETEQLKETVFRFNKMLRKEAEKAAKYEAVLEEVKFIAEKAYNGLNRNNSDLYLILTKINEVMPA